MSLDEEAHEEVDDGALIKEAISAGYSETVDEHHKNYKHVIKLL